MSVDFIFSILILIFSVIIHEVSHGWAAYLQGDNTAKNEGRITLNPIPHIDLFGSIVMPLLMILNNLPVLIAWAKPVPFNKYNLRNQRWGEAIVAFAGPLSNICIALIFGLLIRFNSSFSLSQALINIGAIIVIINLNLATFNLLPIPPLDGSKILFSFLPYTLRGFQNFLERYGFFILIAFVFFLWQFIFPLVIKEFQWVTGISL